MSELHMDLRIFESDGRVKDKRKKELLRVKDQPLDGLTDILKKYFG